VFKEYAHALKSVAAVRNVASEVSFSLEHWDFAVSHKCRLCQLELPGRLVKAFAAAVALGSGSVVGGGVELGFSSNGSEDFATASKVC
jgi:hypothetical protein